MNYQKKDEDILIKLKEVLPVSSSIIHRTRDTNFKENYTSTKINIYDLAFRNHVKEYCSIKSGKKDTLVKMPEQIKHPSDYFRGVIDGDGSLGFKEDGRPFVSLITNSELLYKDFSNFIFIVTGQRKMVKRNSRDGVYNIFITGEHAVNIVKELYYGTPDLFLDRKYELAMKILNNK